ncbi:hypothetical protein CASFOL_020518 [Castilleja foliolosa]|uniref:Cytochrome b5 heme-binding domain-containing protein n=1 Tax=Castilleja foliolosa TaxID=1961234 RepID=A0ABD3D333_9LAMI
MWRKGGLGDVGFNVTNNGGENLMTDLLQPTKELQNYFRFKYYLIVSKIYKHKNAHQNKGTTKNGAESVIYAKTEDEIFVELSSWSFILPLHSEHVPANEVYDVSSYLDEHPGGDDVLLSAVGTDATEEFEDAGHSKTARDLLEQFFIGELDEPPPPIPKLEIVYKKQEFNGIVGKVLNLSKENWAVPVAAVGFLYLRKK